MKKDLKLLKRFFPLAFIIAFIVLVFASCGTGAGNSGSTSLYINLTGKDTGEQYVISDDYYYYASSFFTRGFIDSRGRIFSSKDIQNLAAEFHITSSRFSLKIYEGQTLPADTLCFVYAEKASVSQKERRLVGELYLTSLNGETELNYWEYDSYN